MRIPIVVATCAGVVVLALLAGAAPHRRRTGRLRHDRLPSERRDVPGRGLREVTGRVGEASLTFVTLVLKSIG
jgi:hypothetical protein